MTTTDGHAAATAATRERAGREALVSVLTPVHNGEAFLAETIESVLAQSHSNWRHEIVDNASTDGTSRIAAEYAARDPRITVHRYEELVTQIPNFNRMFRHAHPDAAYVKVIHADDRLFPTCLERMVDVAERHPSVVIVGAPRLDDDRVDLDSMEPGVEVVDGRELSRDLLAARRRFLFGSPSSVLLRAAPLRAFENVHDETFLHSGDSEICYRLLSAGDFGYVHEVLTFTRRQGDTTRPWAVRMGLKRAEQLRLLQRWGRHYLPRGEYERRVAMAVGRYAGNLAGNVRNVRDPEFRRVQGRQLRWMADEGGVGPLVVARGAVRGLAFRLGEGRLGRARARTP